MLLDEEEDGEDEDADDGADADNSSGDDSALMPHSELALFAVRLGFCAYMFKRNQRALLRKIVQVFKRRSSLAPTLLATAEEPTWMSVST